MAMETYFIHGNAVIPEQAGGGNINSPGPLNSVGSIPWTDVLGLPQGPGRSYRGKEGQHVWFHAAVPTPVLTQSVRTELQDVFVLFRADAGCSLESVHVFDGPDRIAPMDGFNSQGDHLRSTIPGQNAFAPREPDGIALHVMRFGLGISMLIRFDREASILFASAGANFITVR
jgi:hypothetical protein